MLLATCIQTQSKIVFYLSFLCTVSVKEDVFIYLPEIKITKNAKNLNWDNYANNAYLLIEFNLYKIINFQHVQKLLIAQF